MKNHNSSGDMKRRHNKEKTFKKLNTKCGPDCGAMPIVEKHPEAGVWHICRECGHKVWMMPAGYITEPGKKKKNKTDPEKAKKYTAKRKAAKEKEMDMNIEALISLT